MIAGRRPVEEAFLARRDAIRLLVVPQRRQALERLVLHATNLRIPIIEVEGGTLTAVAGFDGHQGVGLVVPPRRFATLDEVLARAIERGEPPLVLVMDSLEDPQNVGTLLRSAEAGGAHGVLFPTHRQAPLSPAAGMASAGAVEHLLLCPVDDLAAALADLHVRGIRIVGAEADAPLTARQAELRGPLAIVVGSEGQGLGPAIRRRCDLLVRIPLRGAIDSLNAAVAGSVLLFEAVGQRDPAGTAPRHVPAPLPAAPTEPPPGASPAQEDVDAVVAEPAEPGPDGAVVPPVAAVAAPEPAVESVGAPGPATSVEDVLPGGGETVASAPAEHETDGTEPAPRTAPPAKFRRPRRSSRASPVEPPDADLLPGGPSPDPGVESPED